MDNNFEVVKQKLKEEFFGIDEQIDHVVRAFETWVSVKDYQVRPMTVCLWGLTGTGKTALINRTIELLDLSKKKFYIKFGSKTSNIDDDFEQNMCSDTVFILDEFQYFKTKKEDGSELDRDEDNSTNIIWELLDGGVVNLYGLSMSYSYEKYQLASSIHTLRTLELANSTLKNGVIYNPELRSILRKLHVQLDKNKTVNEEKDDFDGLDDDYEELDCPNYDENDEEIVNTAIKKTDDKNKYNPTEITLKSAMAVNWAVLFDFIKGRDVDYTFHNKSEFYNFLKNITSLTEIVSFLKILKDAKPKLEIRDYSKSLIFVLGNLDECFTMSNDLNSDLDADYFYNQTKNINIIDIRRALSKRFRSEQIARLGSTHIIYPSLNKKAFKAIIDKDLDMFKKTVLHKFSNDDKVIVDDVIFSQNVKDLIYKEGVFPIIGARSVFSITNQIISEKFTSIIRTLLPIDINVTKNVIINFDYDKVKSIINLTYTNSIDNTIIFKESFKYEIKVDKLRSEKNKGKQAHRAVHEAGHAVCSIILEHSFPEVVYSVVLDNKSGGFNLLNNKDFYYHKKNTFLDRIALDLGGYAAEKLIFGEENISNGSSSDIENATSLLSSLFKNCGFLENRLGKFVSKGFTSTDMETSNYSIVDNDEISKEVKNSLDEGLKLAESVLNAQKPLFLKISEYLSKNPKITNKKLKELTKKYAIGITMAELNKDKQLFYTEKLNNELNNLNLK